MYKYQKASKGTHLAAGLSAKQCFHCANALCCFVHVILSVEQDCTHTQLCIKMLIYMLAN